jgi:hypothetical protein
MAAVAPALETAAAREAEPTEEPTSDAPSHSRRVEGFPEEGEGEAGEGGEESGEAGDPSVIPEDASGSGDASASFFFSSPLGGGVAAERSASSVSAGRRSHDASESAASDRDAGTARGGARGCGSNTRRRAGAARSAARGVPGAERDPGPAASSSGHARASSSFPEEYAA